MTKLIGRARRCPFCSARDIGVVANIGGAAGTGRIVAHTPGHGIVRPAKRRCRGSGSVIRLKSTSALKRPRLPTKPTKPTFDLAAIRAMNGRLEASSRQRRLTDIVTIIDAVSERAVTAAGESAIIKPIRLAMTDLEMRTIYELAMGTIVLVPVGPTR